MYRLRMKRRLALLLLAFCLGCDDDHDTRRSVPRASPGDSLARSSNVLGVSKLSLSEIADLVAYLETL